MLVNLSNHPSDKWPVAQKEAAGEFGEIIDIPFPNVPADATETDIHRIATEYISRILQFVGKEPVTVHIMGEQTLCYTLITRLTTYRILCVASCTERNVTELPDGTKQSRFEFVKFRYYNLC